ncbi:hypothetical protein Poly51_17900 [Rubripirellula tenax]|uniref:Aminotransferase class V domain-containing protein n=2 Tax=Rubripirellula tenax TaxID=2528015 RepID=A0A5C6FC62_9BACT|nr:hypothetical protein Poly51_17900 [Rubripirellula tenax]
MLRGDTTWHGESYETLATTGSDRRLIPGPDGSNPYGAGVVPDGAMPLGSCTCSSPSWRAVKASRRTLEKLKQSADPKQTGSQILSDVRATLRRCLQLSPSTDIALTPSGTDVELLPLAVMASNSDCRITNIIVGAGEVGSGTSMAASGCHADTLLPDGSVAVRGAAVNRLLAGRVDVRSIPIRDPSGEPLSMIEIDDRVTANVIEAASHGHRVLVHLVAHSKTGIHAPSVSLIDRLKRTLGDQVMLVVDAAQGRLAADAYQDALDRGCWVSVTGSKFFGGAPFAGALLAPSGVDASAIRTCPAELASYFCRGSLPERWDVNFGANDDWMNVGLLIRWAGAAAEIESFFNIPPTTRQRIADRFRVAVRENFYGSNSVGLLEPFVDIDVLPGIVDGPTVFSLEFPGENSDSLKSLHRSLVRDGWYLGQPVAIGGGRNVLRVALGAPLMIDVANGDDGDSGLTSRLAIMAERIDALGDSVRCHRSSRLAARSRSKVSSNP